MLIAQIWSSQRSLQRKEIIPDLIEQIQQNQYITPVTILEDENGTLFVKDGHHRLAAYILSGRTVLEKHEYVLIQHTGRRIMKITELVKSLGE